MVNIVDKKETNTLCKIGFWVGCASILLSTFLIVPMVGTIISIIGLFKFDKETETKLWMGIVGLILNITYFFAGLYANGIIGPQ